MANQKTISIKSSENYVGKLNEICAKRAVACPDYTVCKSENGEFIITCKMFDNTVTRAKSKVKKDAKRKAAEVMYNMLNARKELRNDGAGFQKCVKSLSNATVRKNISERLSSSAEPVENHVGKLNEINFNNQGKRPVMYTCHAMETGEMIMECKLFDNTVTLALSTCRKDAKQQAAKTMIDLLHEREKMEKIREKLRTQKHIELKKCAEIVSKKTLNATENKTFENHVGKLNELYYTQHGNRPSYNRCKSDNLNEFIVECKILNNIVTRGHSKFRKDAKQEAAKAMLAVLNEREKLRCDAAGSEKKREQSRKDPEKLRHVGKESRNDGEDLGNDTKETSRVCGIANKENSSTKNTVKRGKSQCTQITIGNTAKGMVNDREEREIGQKAEFQSLKPKKLVEYAKKNSRSTLNLKENVTIEPISPIDDFKDFPFEKYLSELGNTHDSYYSDFPSYRIYEFKHDEFNIECSFNDIVTWGQSKFLNVAIRKATEAMLGELDDESKSRNVGVESAHQHYMEFIKSSKNLSVSTLGLTENVNIKLSSPIEPFAQPAKKLNETYKSQEQLATNRECFLKGIFNYSDDIETLLDYEEETENNGAELKSQKRVTFLETDKNVSNLTVENVSDKLSFPAEPIKSLVEKLNEVCFNNQRINPWYTFCSNENGEFKTTCKIYDGTTTQGQSKFIKEAREKSAGEMLDILHDREKSRVVGSKAEEWKNDKEAQNHKYKEFIKCARAYSRFDLNTAKNVNVKVSSPVEAFVNHVGHLYEICINQMLSKPVYIECKIQNEEFMCECKVINKTICNVTRGTSILKRDAKQKASQAMVELLTKSYKLQSQNLMKSVAIIDNTSSSQKISMDELNKHAVVKESDLSHLNEQDLEMALKKLNVNYKISPLTANKNILKLTTKPTKFDKSFTFLTVGKHHPTMRLDLLRKAVFGLRILKK